MLSLKTIRTLLQRADRLPLATQDYPSRGQTAVQELYRTSKGKLFLKRSSKQNHRDCQIDMATGSLAEREYWAYCLARRLGLHTPTLWCLDRWTTVQMWLDIPDGRQYATAYGPLRLRAPNVFACALFDWVTGQIDRHNANYLYNYADQEIILIDSAHGFLRYEGSLPDYLEKFETSHPADLRKHISTPVVAALQTLTPRSLKTLVPLRSPPEMEALCTRLAQARRARRIQDIIDYYRGRQ